MNIIEAANQCLMCKNPLCKKFCPIGTQIPEIIQLFREGKLDEAGEILFKNNPLSAVCSIICSHQDQCMGHCIRGIKGEPVQFYQIEEYISTNYLEKLKLTPPTELKDRIAIVGSGPAGITIAFILAMKGYRVTIFESKEKIGGVLRYGIPDFRLSKNLLDVYEEKLLQLGVKIRPNTLIGSVITIDKLFSDGYKAVFIGTGVWSPNKMDIKGESLGNAHFAIDYLKAPDVYHLGKKVAVIGAGNVAMDAARTAIRSKGVEEVKVFYRKGYSDMTATKVELIEAVEDGVVFEIYKKPVEIFDNGINLVDTQTVHDESNHELLIAEEGKEVFYECDSVIIAVSQSPKNNIVVNNKGFETTVMGLLVTDENGHTTREGVFASGDVVTGSSTVVEVVSNAKVVAESIEEYCMTNTEN